MFNEHVTWDSVLGSGAGSGAVMFGGGVDSVLAQTVHVVDMGLTVSATKIKFKFNQCVITSDGLKGRAIVCTKLLKGSLSPSLFTYLLVFHVLKSFSLIHYAMKIPKSQRTSP